jgi:major membrane immunogen (membrane-anchored lipoprotein)
MGIYSAPYKLVYTVNGSSLDTNLTLSPGTYNTVVEEWDNCGGATTTPITITVANGGTSGVWVTSPGNNSQVGSAVNFVATATSSCSLGVASMGIYTAPYQLAYVGNGASLNTTLTLNPGTYNTVVEEWDKCGGASVSPITITVTGGGSGNTFYNLDDSAGWTGYGQLPPYYQDCSSCGSAVTWSSNQGVSSPAQDGKSMQFTIGGTTPYADVLWNNHLIGDFSSQGLPDTSHTLVPTLHNFTYDVYFYGTNLQTAQALEFDINQFFNNLGFTWGHECRTGGGNEWDVWNNQAGKWVPTGIPCNPINNSWNHLIIQVQRTSDNQLLYQSITLNGVTNTLNQYYGPFSAVGWYGVTVNYQLDGNSTQQGYTTFLDKFNFTYY